jgi:hypothetical protein
MSNGHTRQKRKKNKCGNFGFYPRVMCTVKSVPENIGKS